MKIAQLVCVFPPYKGGIGHSAYYFSKLLARDNRVDVYTPFYKRNKLKEKNNFNLKILKTPFKFGKGAFLYQVFFKLTKYDLVYLHYPFFGTAELVWLAKIIFKKRFKLIIHYHMDTSDLSWMMRMLSWPMKLIEKDLFKRAEAVTYASIDYIQKSQIKDIYKKYSFKFHEVVFGVDDIFLDQKYFQKNNNHFKELLFVGGLDRAHYFKGLSILIEALSKIEMNFFLRVVGLGDLMPYYVGLVERYNLKNKVKFEGNLDDKELFSLYRKADLFILPSINNHEAFGIVLIEAMSQFTPVIASDLPGLRSVFKNEKEGLLFKVGNSYDLAQKILKIFENEKKYQQMCLNARKLVLEKYTWGKVGEQLSRLLRNI